MAQLDRASLHAEVPLKVKSYGAVSATKTTGDSLREMLRDIIDSMLTTYEGIPVGGIILWSGTVDNIPLHWQLCDGTNGTPNLIDKFVRGAGPLTTVFSGGQDQVTLNLNNLPPHSHTVAFNIPGHKHKMFVQGTHWGLGVGSAPNNFVIAEAADVNDNVYDYSMGAAPNGAAEPGSGYTGTAGAQPFNFSSGSTGIATPYDNKPVFYSLCYIQYMGLGAPVDLLPPSVPTPVIALARVTGIDISWGAAYDVFGIDHYDVYLDNVVIGTTDGSTLVFSHDFAIVPMQTYTIKIAAYDAAGNVTYSVNRTTSYIPAPGAFTISIDMAARTHNSHKIDFQCTQDNRDLIEDFVLQYSINSTGPWTMAMMPIGNDVTTVTVAGLMANKTYYFRSQGYGINGVNSPFTPTVYGATKVAPTSTTTTTTFSGGGGAPCPIEGTLITLLDGSQVKIETLTSGTKLLSANIDTYIDSNNSEVLNWSNSKLVITDIEGEIESIERREVSRVVSLNKGEFTVSEFHTHLVRKSGYWKFVNILQVNVGDFMYDEQGNIVEIESVDILDETHYVYKMIMKAPNHLFYANGILTHNFKEEETP